MLEVVEVPHGSERYRRTVALRDAILRKPLGLSFSEEELAAEADSIHLALFEGDELLGCLILKPLSGTACKMRQVAVRPDRQGQGLGRLLVKASEARGFSEIVLHAREAAVGFYLHLGYEVLGEPFKEVGIPHRRMRKDLIS